MNSNPDSLSGYLPLKSDATLSSVDDLNSAESAFKAKLFKRYVIRDNYTRLYPAVIDPKDPNKYFALTMEKAEEWARHRVSFSCGCMCVAM